VSAGDGDFSGEGGGGGFAAGSFLEEEEGGQGFSGDVVITEDGHHLVGQVADFGGVSLLQVGDDQIQGGEGGFVGIAVWSTSRATISLLSTGRGACRSET
jgi:hypothetical protein